jgi:group I intron endonuclease
MPLKECKLFIYKIENKTNGKIYIGQTIQSINIRFKGHIKSSKKNNNKSILYKAMRKYDIQSFEISVVDTADTKEVLNKKEIYWIEYYDCMNPNGYNLTRGGTGGDLSKFHTYRLWTDEEKKIIGIKTKEAMEKMSPEEKERQKQSHKQASKYKFIWNKGLTKETDERVMKISLTEKETKAKNKEKK